MEKDFNVDMRGEEATLMVPEHLIVPHSDKFQEQLNRLYEKKVKLVYLDCSNLKKCDTTGLSSIISYQKRFKDVGREIKLIKVADEHIKHIFRAIQLSRTLSVEEI